MKVKLYANWGESRVITSKEMDKEVRERAEELYKDEEELDAWLSDQFCHNELLHMSEKDKIDVLKNWAGFCYTTAKEELLDGYDPDWEEIEIDIDGEEGE
jgi:hypothetical protein